MALVNAKVGGMNTTTLKQWLEKERGRSKALAAHLDLTAGRVSQMADDGVPAKYMLAVRDFTQGEVALETLVKERATPNTAEAQKAAHG